MRNVNVEMCVNVKKKVKKYVLVGFIDCIKKYLDIRRKFDQKLLCTAVITEQEKNYKNLYYFFHIRKIANFRGYCYI